MTVTRPIQPDIRSDVYGLSTGRSRYGSGGWTLPAKPIGHVHSDVELNYVVEGRLTLFAAGRFVDVGPGCMSAFWAGMPHALVDVEEPTEHVWVSVPLAWFLQWTLPASFVARLLAGEVMDASQQSADDAQEDRLVFTRWAREFGRDEPSSSRLLLEIETRLRRFAESMLLCPSRPALPPASGAGGHVERIAAYISLHYTEDLSAEQIARGVGLHPSYLAQVFKRSCGMGVWEYVLRLRVSHAQRLLATTNMSVLNVAMASGFASLSRFYAAFGRYCGLAPATYRRTLHA